MNDDWQIGDLAVCVEIPQAYPGRAITGPLPTVGETYRVIGLRMYPALYLVLDGAPDCLEFERNWGPLWAARCFRKIRPDKHEKCEPEFVTLLKKRKVTA